jgi:ATP-binding cassette subfamily F protein 3
MALITLSDIKKSFSANIVLDGVSFQVEEKDRIGLIGANGTGKTTLLRILAGLDEPDLGGVTRSRQTAAAYQAQDPVFTEENGVLAEALTTFAPLREVERRLREMETEMAEAGADAGPLDLIVQAHADLQYEFEHRGGYTFEARTKVVLGGLGFSTEQFDLPVKVLSGGQRTRLALARLLLQEGNLLLLDEPTNHLDLAAIEWLEGFLSEEYPGAVVVVSHDRFFLDNVAQRIIEMESHRATVYAGNYTGYLKQRGVRLLTQRREYEKQQKIIEHDEDYIRRNIYGQKHAMAQSRRKRLESMERIERPIGERRSVSLGFGEVARSSDVVLEARDLAMGFDGAPLFKELTLTLARGEVLGIIGPNGAGKTTFLRLLTGELSPTAGGVRLGHNVEIGYYDQRQSGLDPANSVMEEIWKLRPRDDERAVRGFLGRFLFSGEDVFKSVSVLSGGERSRLALAKLILSNTNFLLLDEPTNHLDIPSRGALEEALLDFPGTVIAVTHDRYFLDRVAQKILVIEDGKAQLYLGNYSFYKWMVGQGRAEAEGAKGRDRKKAQATESSKKRRPKMPFEQLEAEIIEREGELAAKRAQLEREKGFLHPDLAAKLQEECAAMEADLAEMNAEWHRLTEKKNG